MRSQQSKRYLGLGDYAGVVDSLLRVMTYDALVWNILAKFVRRETDGHRGRLLLCGALNAAHDEYLRNRLSKDPSLLQNRRWVAKHVGVGLAAFLLYPAIADRRDFWARHAWHQAYFIQVWKSISLVGAHTGPAGAGLAGPAIAIPTYGLAAFLNGERLPLERNKQTRILNYVVAGTAVGLFVRHVVSTLTQTIEQAEVYKQARRGAGSRRAFRAEAAEAVQAADRVLHEAVQRFAVGDSQKEFLSTLLGGWARIRRESDKTSRFPTAIAAQASAVTGIHVQVFAPDKPLSQESAEFTASFVEAILENVAMYSTSKVADVHVDTTANRIQISIVTSDVVDLERIFILGHSLHTLMMYANALGGEVAAERHNPRQTRWIARILETVGT